MAQDTLVTPPVRQSLEDVKSAQANGIAQPLTEKSWYLFFDRLAQMANRQRWIVTYGFHANRPDPAVMPDGALYVEWDRPYVMYQNQGGTWHYIGGTMFGTLSPDQRPTDLGTNDAGFEFRSTDPPPAIPRQFLWSQTAWVEVTPVRGANTLTTVGSIPQVTAPGVLGPSVMTQAASNIGIGTTPAFPLDVVSTATNVPVIRLSTSASGGALGLYNTNANTASRNWAVVGNFIAYGDFAICHSSTQGGNPVLGPANALVYISAAGNLGVGTTSPAYNLDVAGDVNCSGIYRRAGVAGVTATITTAKLTTAGANGSLTFSGGILTGFVQAT
jgi:hypothetical protein